MTKQNTLRDRINELGGNKGLFYFDDDRDDFARLCTAEELKQLIGVWVDVSAPPEASTPNAAAVEAKCQVCGNSSDDVHFIHRERMCVLCFLPKQTAALAATQPHTEVRETVDKAKEFAQSAARFFPKILNRAERILLERQLGELFGYFAADLEAGTMTDKVREYEAMMENVSDFETDNSANRIIKGADYRWRIITPENVGFDHPGYATALEAYAALSEDKQTEEEK